jgi:tetratricopeptide (TPR) repeat protein
MDTTLSQRTSLFLEELDLALQWQRPSLLVAVYESEIIRQHAEGLLAQGIRTLGQTITPFSVDKSRFDIPLALGRSAIRLETVFLVSGLRWGGGRSGLNAYRALNIRRELLVDNPVRAIFWLLKSEARRLPRQAPDFWAFRHRVIEFLDLPDLDLVELQACQKAVKSDPRRAAAWISLGEAWLRAGCLESARKAYQRAALLAPGDPAPWQALARIQLQWARPKEAERLFRKALRLEHPH